MSFLKRNQKFILTAVFTISFAALIIISAITLAQDIGGDIGTQLSATAGSKGAGLGQAIDPRVTIILIIRGLLGFVGIIMIGLNVYSGFLWMTAGGNEEQITKAKGLIKNAVIGLLIVVSAYSITVFVAHLVQGVSYVKSFY